MAALGQRRDVHRVHGDEGGLHQGLLHLLVEALIEGVAPSGLHLIHIHAGGLGCRHRFFVAIYGHKVYAQSLLHRLGHGHALEARGQGHVLPLPLDIVSTQYLHCRSGQQVLKEAHHVVEVGIGFVELHGGELRVMAGIHTLVAEYAPQLIDPLDTAHDQPLQVQLRGYAQIHVYIQGVVVGDKRPGGGAAGDGVEHRGLHLHVASVLQEAADVADELGADDKVAAAILVDDKVHIALAVLKLRIGHAVELLRQRAQGLAQQHHGLDMYGYLLGLGLEHIAADADDVADVVLSEVGKLLLAHGVGAHIELYLAPAVLYMAEYGFAHAPFGHHAAADGDGFPLELRVVVLYFFGPGGPDKLGLLEGISPLLLKSRQLIPAYLQNLRQLLLLGRLLVVKLAHILPLSFIV